MNFSNFFLAISVLATMVVAIPLTPKAEVGYELEKKEAAANAQHGTISDVSCSLDIY